MCEKDFMVRDVHTDTVIAILAVDTVPTVSIVLVVQMVNNRRGAGVMGRHAAHDVLCLLRGDRIHYGRLSGIGVAIWWR